MQVGQILNFLKIVDKNTEVNISLINQFDINHTSAIDELRISNDGIITLVGKKIDAED